MVVRAGDDPDAAAVRQFGELLERRNDALCLRHVELAVRPHEIVLGIDVPEDQTCHVSAEIGRGEGVSWQLSAISYRLSVRESALSRSVGAPSGRKRGSLTTDCR